MSKLEDWGGGKEPGQTGSAARSFCPPVLSTGTFEDESGLRWYRVREGPPTMEREVRMKGVGSSSGWAEPGARGGEAE